MRFAIIEIKLALTAIISRYIILPSGKMKSPLKFDPKTLFITNIPLGGVWINFKQREDISA